MTKPYLGSAVIYVDKNQNEYAATIASICMDADGVPTLRVNLGCLDEDGNAFSVQNINYDLEYDPNVPASRRPDSWHRMHVLRSLGLV